MQKNIGLLDEEAKLMCDRCSGPSDYIAEWHRYEHGIYKLLFAPYDYPLSGGQKKVIKEFSNIGQVMAYCATNLHQIIM
jgi:hypothetical protein